MISSATITVLRLGLTASLTLNFLPFKRILTQKRSICLIRYLMKATVRTWYLLRGANPEFAVVPE